MVSLVKMKNLLTDELFLRNHVLETEIGHQTKPENSSAAKQYYGPYEEQFSPYQSDSNLLIVFGKCKKSTTQ